MPSSFIKFTNNVIVSPFFVSLDIKAKRKNSTLLEEGLYENLFSCLKEITIFALSIASSTVISVSFPGEGGGLFVPSSVTSIASVDSPIESSVESSFESVAASDESAAASDESVATSDESVVVSPDVSFAVSDKSSLGPSGSSETPSLVFGPSAVSETPSLVFGPSVVSETPSFVFVSEFLLSP